MRSNLSEQIEASNLANAELDRQRAELLEKIKSRPLAASQDVQPVHASLCIPDCPICKGQGWITENPEARPGEPGFGSVVSCPNRFKAIITEGNDRFGLEPAELWGLTWDKVRIGISAGYTALAPVQAAVERRHGMIFLWGDYGQAKTLLLKISVAESLRSGTQAVYANLTDILDHVRAAYDDDQAAMNELVNRVDYWSGLPVLAIDELDKSNETRWARERIHQLLDRRYALAVRQKALTLIASNRAAGELDGYLASRLEDARWAGCIIHLSGPDGRKAVPEGYPW